MKRIKQQNIRKLHMLMNFTFFIILFLFFTNISYKNFDTYMIKIAIFSLVIFFINAIFYIKKYRYSLQLVGMNLSMLCFFFGQCYVYLLGEKNLSIFYFSRGDLELISRAYFYSLQFIIVFNIGMIIADKLKKDKKKQKILKSNILIKKILIILILINIFIIFYIVKIFLSGGYFKIRSLNYIEIILKELKYFFNFYLFFYV